jgi:GDP-L-fucose synthase
MLRKFHEAKQSGAKEVVIWGTGSPLREFLHVDDLADACFYLMQHYDEPGLVNIGVGHDISIKDLALLVKKIVGYEGEIVHDLSKPDGTPRKLMDVSKLHNAGWQASIGLEEGIRSVYAELREKAAW